VQFVLFRIKPIRQIHDLSLGAADVKNGEEFEKSSAILAAREWSVPLVSLFVRVHSMLP